MEELDHTPDTSFERDVVCEDEEAFCLSKDNIVALQNLLQQVCHALRQCWGLLCVLAAAATMMEEQLLGFEQGCVLEHPFQGAEISCAKCVALRVRQSQRLC